MTTGDGTPARAEAPLNRSALVVGIESYGVTGAGQGLRGSTRLAARFAQWLIRHRVCRPERITLMAAYEEAAYENGTSGASLSPKEMLAELKLRSTGINMFSQARADQDFGDWINGSHGPRQGDELFVLFWIGHGSPSQTILRRGCACSAPTPRTTG